MTTWDVFHSDRLEVERGLDTAAVRAAIERGDLRDDDLIRPSGTPTPWTRLGDMPPLGVDVGVEAEPEAEAGPAPSPKFEPEPEPEPEAEPTFVGPHGGGIPPSFLDDEVSVPATGDGGEPYGEFDLNLRENASENESDAGTSSAELITWEAGLNGDEPDEEEEDEYDPQDEDEAVAEFTLSRGSAETVEELDLAAMVDVAFQLVLFFLVTATTVLYKSLEVPRPNPEAAPNAAAAQGVRRRSTTSRTTSSSSRSTPPAG